VKVKCAVEGGRTPNEADKSKRMKNEQKTRQTPLKKELVRIQKLKYPNAARTRTRRQGADHQALSRGSDRDLLTTENGKGSSSIAEGAIKGEK